ncbi:MAG: alpha/beta fold hydrolase [Pseudomonadota bacterium]
MVKLPPESRRLYPFASRWATVGGHRYHYLDEGAGPPVVMLHGNPTWSFYYRSLVAGLSGTCRCIAPDHIGCGLSDKPPSTSYGYRLQDRVNDLETFLTSIGITENITLIVHDWGGMIGMAWALRDPRRVTRLVILNTAGFFPPGGKPIPQRLRMLRNLPGFAEPAVLRLNAFARGALWMAPRKPLAPAVKKGLVTPYDSPAHRIATLRFVQDIPVNPSDPSYAAVKRVDDNLGNLAHIPVLICWGKHDFVFDEDYYNEWRRRFPDAEAHLFKDGGHYILEDEPEAVLQRIRNFFARNRVE